MNSSRFEEFLKGIASVHGSVDVSWVQFVKFNSSEFPHLSSKSLVTNPNSTTFPLATANLRSDAVNLSGVQHADLKGDSTGVDVQSSWSSLFPSGKTTQLQFH